MSIRVSVCVCEREREREINESDFFTSIFGAANRERETGIKNINMFFSSNLLLPCIGNYATSASVHSYSVLFLILVLSFSHL